MKKIMAFALATLVALGVSSCKTKVTSGGKPGEIVVVMNEQTWNGPLGTMVQKVFQHEYPGLATIEPWFNLVRVPEHNFRDLFKQHRNIILVELSDENESASYTVEDSKWASGQKVLTLKGRDAQSVVVYLHDHAGELIRVFDEAERERLIANNKQYNEPDLQEAVYTFTGGKMYVPVGWGMKKLTNDFLWMSFETKTMQQGIFIYKYDSIQGDEKGALSMEALVAKRNEVLKEQVPGMDLPDKPTYMTTSRIFDPQVHGRKVGDINVAEMRGLWEVENDFMGGPFISHTFMDPVTREFICIEGYVYAPKENKIKYMRELEAILYSFCWE